MKIEPTVHVLEQLEFCQSSPVWNGFQWTMQRKISCLSKDLISCVQREDIQAWWATIGEGGLALCSGIPVYQSFYGALSRATNKTLDHKLMESGFRYMHAGLEKRVREVSEESRLSFATAFGIGPDLQLGLEKYYDELDLSNISFEPTIPMNNLQNDKAIYFQAENFTCCTQGQTCPP